MTPLFVYLLKVFAVSGILYGYYLIALRNKVFHSWNRFYLLATIGLSILLPFIDLDIIIASGDNEGKVVNALRVVAGADEFIMQTPPESTSWSMESGMNAVYLLLSIVTLIWLMAGLSKIYRLVKQYPQQRMQDIVFLNTRETGTPFSFFRYLFWHEEIDPASINGQKILEHELVHIREKHSHDKIFVHLALTAFWANPIFWLIRKELAMVHEFIADQQTVDDGESFAQLILSATFPEHSNLLTNAYFHSSIKRRINMITRNKHPRYQYISRLLLIPVLFVLLFAFGVKANDMFSEANEPIAVLNKKVTVVIDAGHGGFDPGAVNGSAKEKDVNLELAKLVKELNKNANLNIVLTREEDKTLAVSSRKEIADDLDAQLFISLHSDASPNAKLKGFSAYISGQNPSFEKQNQRLASLFLHNLSSLYKTDLEIKKRQLPIYVLDKSTRPAVILQNGFITNQDDKAFMSKKENQKKVASIILQSIEEYFNEKVQVANPAERISIDTVPAGKSGFYRVTPDVKVTRIFINGKEIQKGAITSFVKADKVNMETNTKGEKLIYIITADGTKEVKKVVGQPLDSKDGQLIRIDHSGNQMVFVQAKDTLKVKEVTLIGQPKPMNNPLFILEGKEISQEIMGAISPEKISAVNVLKGESAEKKYGAKGANGVVEILLKDSRTVFTGSSTNEVTAIGYKKIDTATSNQSSSPKEITVVGYSKAKSQPLYIVNGKELPEVEFRGITPDRIESINVLKGEAALQKYGAKGKNGILEIILKK